MNIVRLNYPLQTEIPETAPKVIAIGDFDGVHLGHRHVIHRAVQKARKYGTTAAIMTFDPHPREVLSERTSFRYLAPLSDKLQQFEKLGVDTVYLVRFDLAFSKVIPGDFVENMLLALQIEHVVVGFDFTFGHRGRGTVETLKQLAKGRFAVEVIRPYHLDGDKVSSTLIREQLQLGDMKRVSRYLGRYYTIQGVVVQGDARGRQIGFPTANIEPVAPYIIPCQGVYAVRVLYEGIKYPSVMNVGVRPTFKEDGAEAKIEIHLLGFSGDLYGKPLTVELIAFLRKEQRFQSIDELVAQIQLDIKQAVQILKSESC